MKCTDVDCDCDATKIPQITTLVDANTMKRLKMIINQTKSNIKSGDKIDKYLCTQFQIIKVRILSETRKKTQ